MAKFFAIIPLVTPSSEQFTSFEKRNPNGLQLNPSNWCLTILAIKEGFVHDKLELIKYNILQIAHAIRFKPCQFVYHIKYISFHMYNCGNNMSKDKSVETILILIFCPAVFIFTSGPTWIYQPSRLLPAKTV